MEKKEPPIYKTPAGEASRLHSFTAMPSDRTTIMGARRCPPVTTPMGNNAKSVTLFTSTGFSSVTIPQYAAAIEALRPDVAIPLADALHTSPTPNSKKLFKMVERTEEWLDELLQHFGPGRDKLDALGVSLFAPVLPVEHPIQWDYLRHLAEDVTDSLSGLAVYNVALLPELTCYQPFASLPKLSLDPPKTPHDILRQISLGVDIVTVPFINTVSDSGIALTFAFPPPSANPNDLLPMGVDMWSPEHATSVTPLADGCKCYTCTHHHRAYLHHLLNAKSTTIMSSRSSSLAFANLLPTEQLLLKKTGSCFSRRTSRNSRRERVSDLGRAAITSRVRLGRRSETSPAGRTLM